MTKNTMLKILNPVLAVFFINQAVSVIFREHYTYSAFGIFHKTAGGILLCLIALHLILNFNWFKASYFRR
jgi:hypothetical protein